MINASHILMLSLPLTMPVFGRTALAGAPPILETKVFGFDEANGLLALDAGSDNGVGLDDPFWIFADKGIVADGFVYLVTDRRSVGRLSRRPTATVATGQTVTLLRNNLTKPLRDHWPQGVTMHGLLAEVSPDHKTARLDIGRLHGLRPGDNLIIRRKGIPISRGRIVDLQDHATTLSLQPVVRNALPAPGDAAELWPRPADLRLGRVSSWVLDIQPIGERRQVIIVGTAADGLAIDRAVDIYRHGKYIACAVVNNISDPLSTALIMDAMSADVPQAGDEVLARPPLSSPDTPFSVAVFRVDQDGYCLLAGGEEDGFQIGDRFIIRHQEPGEPAVWRDIAELTIARLSQDFSGAYAYPLGPDLPSVAQWDLADRITPRLPQWRPIGILTEIHVERATGIADIDPRSELKAGDLVRLAPYAPKGEEVDTLYAALVVYRFPDRVALYMPPGWGDPRAMKDARVDSLEKTMLYPLSLPGRRAPATQPSTTPGQ